jgi:hypothetical protein
MIFTILFENRRQEFLKERLNGTRNNHMIIFRTDSHACDIAFSYIPQFDHKIVISTPYGNHGAFLKFSNPTKELFSLDIPELYVDKYKNNIGDGIKFLLEFSKNSLLMNFNDDDDRKKTSLIVYKKT